MGGLSTFESVLIFVDVRRPDRGRCADAHHAELIDDGVLGLWQGFPEVVLDALQTELSGIIETGALLGCTCCATDASLSCGRRPSPFRCKNGRCPTISHASPHSLPTR